MNPENAQYWPIPGTDNIGISLSIKGLDGYETFAIDKHTIGIRPKWISVNERLPEHDGEYLIFCEDESRYIAVFENEDKIWRNYEYMVQHSTHWMPLPEKPKD